MNKYYRWFENLSDYKEPVVQLTRFELNEIDEWDLREGKKIDHWNLNNTAYYEDDGIAYDLLSTTI